MYAFDYIRPSTLAEAIDKLASDPDAKILAGGQSILPVMKQRLSRPSLLVDLSGVPGLCGVTSETGKVRLGALTRHSDVASSPVVADMLPALSRLAAGIGDVQVRHRGTVGGSIANNDPAADYPAACLALGATIVTSRRSIHADDFFVDMFETALSTDEIIVGIDFPVPDFAAYRKFRHPISRYALVGVFVARVAGQARVAVTGAAASVFRLSAFERLLDRDWSVEAIAHAVFDENALNSDIHASAAYRAHMIRHLTMDALSGP